MRTLLIDLETEMSTGRKQSDLVTQSMVNRFHLELAMMELEQPPMNQILIFDDKSDVQRERLNRERLTVTKTKDDVVIRPNGNKNR